MITDSVFVPPSILKKSLERINFIIERFNGGSKLRIPLCAEIFGPIKSVWATVTAVSDDDWIIAKLRLNLLRTKALR